MLCPGQISLPRASRKVLPSALGKGLSNQIGTAPS